MIKKTITKKTNLKNSSLTYSFVTSMCRYADQEDTNYNEILSVLFGSGKSISNIELMDLVSCITIVKDAISKSKVPLGNINNLFREGDSPVSAADLHEASETLIKICTTGELNKIKSFLTSKDLINKKEVCIIPSLKAVQTKLYIGTFHKKGGKLKSLENSIGDLNTSICNLLINANKSGAGELSTATIAIGSCIEKTIVACVGVLRSLQIYMQSKFQSKEDEDYRINAMDVVNHIHEGGAFDKLWSNGKFAKLNKENDGQRVRKVADLFHNIYNKIVRLEYVLSHDPIISKVLIGYKVLTYKSKREVIISQLLKERELIDSYKATLQRYIDDFLVDNVDMVEDIIGQTQASGLFFEVGISCDYQDKSCNVLKKYEIPAKGTYMFTYPSLDRSGSWEILANHGTEFKYFAVRLRKCDNYSHNRTLFKIGLDKGLLGAEFSAFCMKNFTSEGTVDLFIKPDLITESKTELINTCPYMGFGPG